MTQKIARAVIGAGYGDEGKGLMVDALAAVADPDTLVVRTNSGAQAGHTVTTPDGRRHVFHHFGSGALAGRATHLSRFFVAAPMLFFRERDRLSQLGAETSVSIDPFALITTPYDIMANQIVEVSRGTGRHGSCGVGFGETVERSLTADFAIRAGGLMASDLPARLRRIRDEWLPSRLAALGVTDIPEPYARAMAADGIIDSFLHDVDAFRSAITLVDDAATGSRPVILEGAQGLLLDQDYGAFPHVTRSNTGLVNMAQFARIAGFDAIDVTYMTRAYVTRHGAGPMDREQALPNVDLVDMTNVPNDWQGDLRTAPLDIDTLVAAIRHDISRADGVDITASLGVSCLDQIHGATPVFVGGKEESWNSDLFLTNAAAAAGLPALGSWGPTRDTIAPLRQVAA